MKVLSLHHIIAGLATVLSVRQINALCNQDGIFHRALIQTWEQIQAEARQHRLRIDWSFAPDEINGQRLCIDRALAEVQKQRMVRAIGTEIQVEHWMWQEKGAPLYALPGQPEMYERLTDVVMGHHRALFHEHRVNRPAVINFTTPSEDFVGPALS